MATTTCGRRLSWRACSAMSTPPITTASCPRPASPLQLRVLHAAVVHLPDRCARSEGLFQFQSGVHNMCSIQLQSDSQPQSLQEDRHDWWMKSRLPPLHRGSATMRTSQKIDPLAISPLSHNTSVCLIPPLPRKKTPCLLRQGALAQYKTAAGPVPNSMQGCSKFLNEAGCVSPGARYPLPRESQRKGSLIRPR